MTLARSRVIMHRRRVSQVSNTQCFLFFTVVVVTEEHQRPYHTRILIFCDTFILHNFFLYYRYTLPDILQMYFHVILIIYAAEISFETILMHHARNLA